MEAAGRDGDGDGDLGTASLPAALAVFVGLLVSGRSNDLLPSPERLAFLGLGIAALALVAIPRVRAQAPVLVALLLVVAGTVLRVLQAIHPGGSDVLPVTDEALTVWLGGGNPYAHAYASSSPPGAPFPYPPVNLLVHLPGHLLAGLPGTRATELVAAVVVLLVLGRLATHRGHPLAMPMLALYAALPNLLNLVGDGSNDTSAGAAIVLFMLGLAATRSDERRSAVLAGVLAAVALGTKQSALPIVVAGTAWLFRARRPAFAPYSAATLGVLALVSVPFVLQSGPVDYLRALTAFAGFHEDVYGWNVWVLAQQLGWPVASRQGATILGAAIALLGLAVVAVLPYRSVRTALAAGTVAMAVLFLAQRWTAYSYFVQLLSALVVLPLLPHRGPGVDGANGEDDRSGAAAGDQYATKPIRIAHSA